MAATKSDLDVATKAWLDAQAGYTNFLQVTETLFAVFAEGWRGPRRALSEAFSEFREALLRDSGYSPMEVSKVYPPRSPESE